MYSYKYPRAALSVDCVVFGIGDEGLKVLLIQRGGEPFRGHWALPGGFLEMDERLDQAAKRELEEETGLEGVELEQLHAFSEVDRDPRERVISVAYWGVVECSAHMPKADSDAAEAKWFGVESLPALAFDHGSMLRMAWERLRLKAERDPEGWGFLPKDFPI